MDETQIKSILEQAKNPIQPENLAKRLGISPEELIDALQPMAEQGQILFTKKGAVALPAHMGLVAGEFRATQSEAAFLIPDEGEDDFFLPKSRRMGAMNGDRVLVRIRPAGQGQRRAEGEVTRVVKRANELIVGEYVPQGKGGVVLPSDNRIKDQIAIGAGKELGAVAGSLVTVKIIRYPDGKHDALGKVMEVLGSKNEFSVQLKAIIRSHKLRDTFSEEVAAQAEAEPEAITPRELEGRLDLRAKRVFTIDGAEAKDLDDAISLEMLPNGNYLLGVHIADVSHYVTPGSPIDREAWQRGTSVYMLNTVIPMLPERLSNGICSLHGGVERLTMTALMELDAGNAKTVKTTISPSVIKSSARLTYSAVNNALEKGDESAFADLPDVLADLKAMNALREKLFARRLARGTVDLDIDEADIRIAPDGEPEDILLRERGVGQRLVEEFMLCANEAVAEHLSRIGMPAVYRVHDIPDPEKMAALAIFLKNLGIPNDGLRGDVHPRQLQKVVDYAAGTQYENIISRVMLRSMRKAVYSTQNRGHFGLGAEYYCHFTSPIRRYPDLTVHRQLKKSLGVFPTKDEVDAMTLSLENTAKHASQTERDAMEAERDADDMMMARYMSKHVGEEFDGVVSGVTEHGFFVELPNLVEGFIRLTSLDDWFVLNREQYSLRGERSGKVYRMGDPVHILVTSVDTETNRIDFDVKEKIAH
ncbi:MAG: ribonuclease R [Eubacteriales bacterium]|nr:ribonuclease R [Eubacteriales bacterium]